MSEQEKILHGKSEKLRLGPVAFAALRGGGFCFSSCRPGCTYTDPERRYCPGIFVFTGSRRAVRGTYRRRYPLFWRGRESCPALLDWLISVTFPGAFLWYVTWPVGRLLWPLAFFLLITTVAAPLGDIAYLNRPEIVELSQVELELDNWSDATNVSMKGIADDGRDYEFNVGRQSL